MQQLPYSQVHNRSLCLDIFGTFRPLCKTFFAGRGGCNPTCISMAAGTCPRRAHWTYAVFRQPCGR